MSYKYTYFDRMRQFLFRSLPNFLRNIYKFRKALWNHHWWDYSGSLQFIEVAVDDISKNIEAKGNEVKGSKMKKVEKMNRVVEILKNIREDRYFDIVEVEMGKRYNTKNIEFVPCEDNPDYYELVDYDNDEEKEFNDKYFERVTQIENEEWNELWEILKGQDYEKFDKVKPWDEQFDGTGMKGWWD